MAQSASGNPAKGLCPSCGVVREMADEQEVRIPEGHGKERAALQGACHVCGASIYVIK